VVWPSPNGIGIMDAAAFDVTAQIALDYGIISEAVDPAAVYRTDLAQAALDRLIVDYDGMDFNGVTYEAPLVEITPNGE